MKSLLPKEKLEELWNSLLKQVGNYKRAIDVRTEKADPYVVVYVTCEFEKLDLDVKIVLNREGKISGLFFLPASPKSYSIPSYVDIGKFREEDITIGSTEFPLPGKITVPIGEGPFPLVILVHGSGPNDMDESIGPNKPFRDLAYGLSTMGIAVLRYDKRTKAHTDKFVKVYKDGFTVWEEVIEDVLYAIDFALRRNDIDRNKIFILGHSLGGMLLPRIAKASGKIAGLIIMAGPTRPLEDLIWEQVNYIYSLDGEISEEEKTQLDILKREIEKIKKLDNLYSSSDLILGTPVKYWKDLKDYNPAEELSSLNLPVLILQGGRDYQVTLEDFNGWKSYLKNNNAKFKLYDKLNHLFLEGEGKSIPEEYYKEGHIPEYVIKDIADFVLSK